MKLDQSSKPEPSKDRTPGAQPREERAQVKLRAPDRVAAGMHALAETLKFTARETGFARAISDWLKINKKDGFDCQSCAWPNPDRDRHVFEFCENGVKALTSEATKKQIGPEFFRKHSIADLQEQTDHWLELQGRLVHPMVKREGASHYQPIDWNDAFELMARELNALPTPNAATFYTSGRTSNEAAFLYQLFSRQFGTNNLPDCSNMCHESSGTALSETIGVGKGTVMLEDFELAQAIFVIGQNPGTNHPRMLTSVQRDKRNGAKIVHINPLPETGMTRFKHPQEISGWLGKGTPLADLFLQVRINGDVALLKGIMKEILAEEEKNPGRVLDHEFINEYTAGFKEFAAALRKVHWGDLLDQCGVHKTGIEDAAKVFIQSERTIFCWAMGLTQHKNAVANIQEIVNLMLLRGQIGRPGAGLCTVRGHSNVQGDRTLGIWERTNDALHYHHSGY